MKLHDYSGQFEHDDDIYDDDDDLYRDDEMVDVGTEDEEEPPPTEPIFPLRYGADGRYSSASVGQPHMERAASASEDSYGGAGEVGYASEKDHSEDDCLVDRVTRTKKVSFAAENEQFNLKPDPDVKTIPGTNLYCFAPSSTHEQPEDIVDSGSVTKSDPKVKKAISKDTTAAGRIDANAAGEGGPGVKAAEATPPPQSTSPMAFLKSMTGGGSKGSRESSRSRAESGGAAGKDSAKESSRERHSSILDSLLRRGRSLSASRNSSRQSSVDRSETKATGVESSHGSDAGGGGGLEADATAGSEYSGGSDTSFFKRMGKKKRPPVQPIDFDELFARGHALSAQLEDSPGASPGSPGVAQSESPLRGPPVSFSQYSKDEAFLKSRQGAGLSYTDKVHSYLQQEQHYMSGPATACNATTVAAVPAPTTHTTHTTVDPASCQPIGGMQQPCTVPMGACQPHHTPITHQPSHGDPEGPQTPDAQKGDEQRRHRSSDPKSRSRSKSNQRKAASYTSPEDVRLDMAEEANVPAVGKGSGASPQVVTGSGGHMATASFVAMKMRSRDPAGEDQGAHTPTDTLGHSVKRRQMTPEQFLRRVEDFVRNAELPKDSQPSWPATVIKKDQRASPFKDLLQKMSPRSSPRGGSPLKTGLKTHSVPSPSDYEYPVVKSSGKSYLDKPSSLSPDPFQSRVAEEPPPPAPSAAQASSSSIIANLRMRTSSGSAATSHAPETVLAGSVPQNRESDVDDEIMLDLRKDREELGYTAIKSNYDYTSPSGVADIPKPSVGGKRSPLLQAPADISLRRSPMVANKSGVTGSVLPAGSRSPLNSSSSIPAQLSPDPLLRHEPLNAPPTLFPAQAATACSADEGDLIKNSELYRRLQEGLTNFDKLVQGETFKREMARSGVDLRKYSSHLGRAEFGDLKKRSSLGNLTGPVGGGGGGGLGRGGSPASYPIKQSSSATHLMGRSKFGGGGSGFASLDHSRDSSRERPGSHFSKQAHSRHHSGRDDTSQERRPDSRQSDNMLPDLERFQDPSHTRTSSAARTVDSLTRGQRPSLTIRQTPPPSVPASTTDTSTGAAAKMFHPSPDVLEKRKRVLKSMATDKQSVKEAKVTKKVISGWGDGPEFTYVIDRTGGGSGSAEGPAVAPAGNADKAVDGNGGLLPHQSPMQSPMQSAMQSAAPQAPVRLKRGVSPRGLFSSKSKSKQAKGKPAATEIRRIDFERDAPQVDLASAKKKPKLRTTACCKVT